MTIVALDTLAVVKTLKAAGFTEEQAEAVTGVVRLAQDLGLANLATKADLAALTAATKADFADTKVDIAALGMTTKADIAALAASTRADIAALAASNKVDLAELRSEILKWMVTTIGLQTVVILGSVIGLLRMMLKP